MPQRKVRTSYLLFGLGGFLSFFYHNNLTWTRAQCAASHLSAHVGADGELEGAVEERDVGGGAEGPRQAVLLLVQLLGAVQRHHLGMAAFSNRAFNAVQLRYLFNHDL